MKASASAQDSGSSFKSKSDARWTPYATAKQAHFGSKGQKDIFIPKGLQMGEDNLGGRTAKACYDQLMADGHRHLKRFHRKQLRACTSDAEVQKFAWKLARKQSAAKVFYGHPAANDETVCYTVVPASLSRCGAFTIRWWYQFERGYCFDFVDREQRKVVLPPQNLTMKESRGENKWRTVESLEDGMARQDRTWKKNPNADGIVEHRFVVGNGALLALHFKDEPKPFLHLEGPKYEPPVKDEPIPLIRVTYPRDPLEL